ncbi:MAG: alpha-amylase [Chitinophagaceae bacterium]|nr:alpha-amylase [Chitinophagaceae bacterium]
MITNTNSNSTYNNAEVIYHIFQRSFFDSNNDKHGDLNGLKEKLDYLQDLGITSVLLTPLNSSPYYHNYFADNFEVVDPKYGTLEDFYSLVHEVHKRGMKIYIDMEVQYVTEDHLWFKDSFENPASPYSDYVLYKDAENKIPDTIIYDTTGLLGYDGVYKKITTVNLLNDAVQKYMYKYFSNCIDPKQDGSFDYGVDGFRLDHMMDMLDGKEKLNHLFSSFWKPLIESLKQINPSLVFIAEQTNWGSYGEEYINEVGADHVFAFPLREAILSVNKDEIGTVAEKTFSLTEKQEQQIVFIENHDTHRFATAVFRGAGKMRVGAALNILIGGTPAIYYGQEIGMKGGGGFGKYGNSDGNDIPRREAFKWYKNINEPGMCLWYEKSGPWWDDSTLPERDSVPLEQQVSNPHSLWNYYKKLIHLRRQHPALISGVYKTITNDAAALFSFTRETDDEIILVVVNLTGYRQRSIIHIGYVQETDFLLIMGNATLSFIDAVASIEISSYNTGVWKLK